MRIGCIIIALLVAFATDAGAQDSPGDADPFSALVGRDRSTSERQRGVSVVDRYISATGDEVFLFQSIGADARLKFLCGLGDTDVDCLIDDDAPAEEILLLAATRGPRGDTIYRDDSGEAWLRVTAYGGATAYRHGDRSGRAATRSYSEDPPLVLPIVTEDAARLRATRATALVSAALGAPMTFEVGEAGIDEAKAAAVLADAVARAAKALHSIAESPAGAKALRDKYSSVRFRAGESSSVTVDARTIVVSYNPHRDVHGRPSTADIVAFIEAAL